MAKRVINGSSSIDSIETEDPSGKQKRSMSNLLGHWKGKQDFLKAQASVIAVLVIAYIGDRWPYHYPRNDNHKPYMFWIMNLALAIAAVLTLKHDSNASSRGVQLLSRPQTEEWKGWMQWAFIMYHYYRMYAVYNEIRVFVSAYVWMTGFGNFLYFDKASDFSMERAVSMWLRINYFPLLLSFFLGVKLELYYVVPLHTAGFFITMITCYLGQEIEKLFKWSRHRSNAVAISVCVLVHVLFYQTPAVNFLKVFSDEYFFRFQADKYSAVVGIISGYFWGNLKEWMQMVYNTEEQNFTQVAYMWAQRAMGVLLIGLWYGLFGYLDDKFIYNPMHPYIFWMPVAGWLMLRNSSKYLCELHSGALEFFGRITLETYVLQFHLFMCQQVQHIPIVIPNSGSDGPLVLQTLNMLLCGVIFVAVAHWARHITVDTQKSVTELLTLLRRGPPPSLEEDEEEQVVALTKTPSESKEDA